MSSKARSFRVSRGSVLGAGESGTLTIASDRLIFQPEKGNQVFFDFANIAGFKSGSSMMFWEIFEFIHHEDPEKPPKVEEFATKEGAQIQEACTEAIMKMKKRRDTIAGSGYKPGSKKGSRIRKKKGTSLNASHQNAPSDETPRSGSESSKPSTPSPRQEPVDAATIDTGKSVADSDSDEPMSLGPNRFGTVKRNKTGAAQT